MIMRSAVAAGAVGLGGTFNALLARGPEASSPRPRPESRLRPAAAGDR